MKLRTFAMVALLLCGGCAALPPRMPPPGVQEVVQWSQQKVDAAEIIGRMRESHAVYRLSGSQLAGLREQGVSDAVIDYMQGTHLDAVQREAAEREFLFHNPLPPGMFHPFGPRSLRYRPFPWGW